MAEKQVNASVKIVFLPTTAKATYLGAEKMRIRETVRNELLFPSKQPYHKVQVTVRRRPDGTPESLVAFMLRAYTYTADIARINLDSEYGAKSVTFLPGESEEADVAPPDVPARRTRAALQVDMVFGTPVPEIPAAKAAVEYRVRPCEQVGL